MSVVHIEAVIANAGTESGVVDLTDRVLCAIHMPSDWDAADLSLKAAVTAAGPFRAVVSDEFDELLTVAVDQVVVVPPDLTRGLAFVKLVASAAQTPARTFYLATVEDDDA